MRYKLALAAFLIITALSALHLFSPVSRDILWHLEQDAAADLYVYQAVAAPAAHSPRPGSGDESGRQYMFADKGAAGGDAFILEIERLLDALTMIIPPEAQIFDICTVNIISSHELVRPSPLGWGDGVSIVYDSYSTLGWLTQAISGGHFPMWLSVGIEVIAMGERGQNIPGGLDAYENDSFGDSFFAPVHWGRNTWYHAVYMASRFTQFLIDEDVFFQLAVYYSSGNLGAADTLVAEYFYRFTGSHDIEAYRLVITQTTGYAYAIYAVTEVAEYRFWFDTFGQEADFDRIAPYIDYMDDAIAFVVDWYSQGAEFYFYPMDVNIFYRRHEHGHQAVAVYPWRVELYNFGSYSPTSMPHEVSHLLTTLILDDVGMVFTPFDEGLAFALMAYHGQHDRHNHGLEYQFRQNRRGWLASLMRTPFGRSAPTIARNLVDEFDIIGIFHMLAFLENGGYANGTYLYFWSRTDVENKDTPGVYRINTFGKAASFVLYLIENYGADAYMQVHLDFLRFYEVYGVTLYEMTQSWLIYLQNFVEGI